MNIKLILTYDGSHYLGWQRTNEGPSIENMLTKALQKILQTSPKLQAASRTDAGVHAMHQVVNFFAEDLKDLDQLMWSLNKLLPKDIRVIGVNKEPDTFHPSLDVQSKEYLYKITNASQQMPFDRNFSWHFPYPINVSLMKQASKHFIGTKDFACFCNQSSSPPSSTIRTIDSITIDQQGNSFSVIVKGKCFFYRMVRNLVGTLAYIGSGKLSHPKKIIETKKRCQAGITAPAHGLFLKNIHY